MSSYFEIPPKEKLLKPSKINEDISGYYFIVPTKAVKDIRLHRNPILFQILNLMCSYANNKTQQLFVSQARLAMITGKHQSTISKQIHLLVNLGYIDILKTGSPWSYSRVKTSRYKIIWK